MPHKVNPIDFENAEGNLGIANAFFQHFSEKLPISRLQRDLSDSTVMRNLGSALAYTILAFTSIAKGLEKITAHPAAMKADLDKHPEVLAEAIQIVLRREKVPQSYEILKKITRGKSMSRNSLEEFIDHLAILPKVKKEIKKLKVEKYLGLSKKLAQIGLK